MNKYVKIQNSIIRELLEFSKITNHYGMIGWIKSDNCLPEYIYGEITGYFLSFCCDVCACRPYMKDRLLPIMQSHVEWLKQRAEKGFVTRYMLNGQNDWRNCVIFPFDIAMIIRGLRDAREYVNTESVLNLYKTIFEDFINKKTGELSPYIYTTKSEIPDKWSTRFDAHFMKIVANTLPEYTQVYDMSIANILIEIEKKLFYFDDKKLLETDSHPLMYYLEGLILLSNLDSNDLKNTDVLERAVLIYKKIIENCKNGLLRDNLLTGTYHRSDVLAQFVRMGAILDIKGYLDEDEKNYVRCIFESIIDKFVENGKVCFFEKNNKQNYYNTWCAMFLYQAIEFFNISSDIETKSNFLIESMSKRIF